MWYAYFLRFSLIHILDYMNVLFFLLDVIKYIFVVLIFSWSNKDTTYSIGVPCFDISVTNLVLNVCGNIFWVHLGDIHIFKIQKFIIYVIIFKRILYERE